MSREVESEVREQHKLRCRIGRDAECDCRNRDPSHDCECEAELTSHGFTPCRCEERAMWIRHELAKAAAAMGRKGGKTTGGKKAEAARQNASRPRPNRKKKGTSC